VIGFGVIQTNHSPVFYYTGELCNTLYSYKILLREPKGFHPEQQTVSLNSKGRKEKEYLFSFVFQLFSSTVIADPLLYGTEKYFHGKIIMSHGISTSSR
jgi:hypothetical protein